MAFEDVYDKTCLHYMKGKGYVMCNKVHDSCRDCKDYTKARLTHSELVNLGASYLKRAGYEVILVEPGYRSELPDVLGFKSGYSCLIECKASRADFLRDKKKPFRNGTVKGIGSERIYLTNPGVANVSDVPPKWKLYWAINENRIEVIKPFEVYGFIPDFNQYRFSAEERNLELENNYLYSWCYRKLNGCLPNIRTVGKEFEVKRVNEPEYAKEVFKADGYCAFCIHRNNPIDECNKGWKDSKINYGELDMRTHSGINRTGLVHQDYRYFNGQQCKGFEIDNEIYFSKKNNYKEEM